MANQCVNMVEAYLDQLREEGCKLIQWSDDLKHHLPPGPSTPSHSGSGTFLAGKQNGVSTVASPPVDSSSPIQGDLLSPGGNTTPSNNARNFDQFQLNSLDTSQLAKEFPHLSGQNDVHRLLMILYNNYKFVLKKYEELNEQKLSYIEGLKEYQYKLDNSNYLIQLQRSQLSNLTNVAPSNPDLAANSGAVAAGWLNKEHTLLNRERELIRLKEEELMSKQEELKSKEASFVGREEALMARQLELNSKEADLVAREQELASRQEALADRESDLAARESELTERERLLAENEELFKAKQDEFLSKGSRERHEDPSLGERDKSIFVEEHGEVVYKAVRPNTNHGAQGTNAVANKSYEDEE
ncbi:hypothetical protein MACJ_003702 [Theileria orientalis]|uniref:Uncharacterized protein n=1 Tax=Theileria orientalis TaxID=68886 RepID=A0A976SLJ4_THEOR|nr:hypothetical protein MACJ_003702 [Theileria orientalis]